MHAVRPLSSELSGRCLVHGSGRLIIVVGSGLVAVSAASRLLESGHDVTLTTAHAEFGFPHGGCGLWNTDVLPWPLQTIEEAVGAMAGSRVACRSQWLVKRLVHRFTTAGGRTSTRVRLTHDAGTWESVGTGAVPLHVLNHVIVADQDVPEPALSAGAPLLTFERPIQWYGAVVIEGTPIDIDHAGARADGTVEAWTMVEDELLGVQRLSLETMRMTWNDEGHEIDAARCMQRAHEAVDEFLMSNGLGVA